VQEHGAVLRALDGFEGRAHLRTLAFRTLANTARRHGKREARMNEELVAGSTIDLARFRGDDGPDWPRHLRDDAVRIGTEPEPALLARSLVMCSRQRSTPERQRAVVELRDVHGFEAEEVCALLDLTPANQRVLLHRGRARLRAVWEAAAS
jgi:RNA polymerase sigma-70 factor, ECF subfamily